MGTIGSIRRGSFGEALLEHWKLPCWSAQLSSRPEALPQQVLGAAEGPKKPCASFLEAASPKEATAESGLRAEA